MPTLTHSVGQWSSLCLMSVHCVCQSVTAPVVTCVSVDSSLHASEHRGVCYVCLCEAKCLARSFDKWAKCRWQVWQLELSTFLWDRREREAGEHESKSSSRCMGLFFKLLNYLLSSKFIILCWMYNMSLYKKCESIFAIQFSFEETSMNLRSSWSSSSSLCLFMFDN